jgi:hypothetical protein
MGIHPHPARHRERSGEAGGLNPPPPRDKLGICDKGEEIFFKDFGSSDLWSERFTEKLQQPPRS